jgi:hypothetical protein
MARRMVAVLGGDPGVVEGYGKGAIVGAAGELEHGALWHVPGGWAMREVLGDTRAIVPSTKKVGGPGTRLDVPVTHVNAAYVRSHFDAIEVGLNDAPRADELALVLVMTTGPRIHARVGGLAPRRSSRRGWLALAWPREDKPGRHPGSRKFNKEGRHDLEDSGDGCGGTGHCPARLRRRSANSGWG